MTNGDKVILPLTDAGRKLAENVKAAHPTPQHVSEAVVEIAGHLVLELTVHGKRTGEGLIARDMKAKKS